jgi:hypothetical protein
VNSQNGNQSVASTELSVGKSSQFVVREQAIKEMLNSKSNAFPRIQDSPPEYVDSLDFVAPCRIAGCSKASTGGHNLHWYVTRAEGDSGRSYYVKGEDNRCWERLDWDSTSIQITFDNCWWGEHGYNYSRYADGRWLARIWKPGDSIVTDHTVYGGHWDSCKDMPIGQGQKRVMTFLWRVKDFDWGPAGNLDTIAVMQSYPHEARIREYYVYARGHGLIGWSYENDINPSKNSSHLFNLTSQVKPVPQGTKCVQVETVSEAPAQPAKTPVAAEPVVLPSLPKNPAPAASPTPVAATPPPTTAPMQPTVTSTPTQQQQASCTVTLLRGGTSFVINQPFYSCSQKYSMVFQADGNMVLYNTISKAPIWHTSTANSGAQSATFQTDGNLVIMKGITALWHSNTYNSAGAELLIQDDGNLVIRSKAGAVIWHSNTAGR